MRLLREEEHPYAHPDGIRELGEHLASHDRVRLDRSVGPEDVHQHSDPSASRVQVVERGDEALLASALKYVVPLPCDLPCRELVPRRQAGHDGHADRGQSQSLQKTLFIRHFITHTFDPPMQRP